MAEPGYDEDGNPLVQGVVSATGVVVVMHDAPDVAKRLEEAMVRAIQECNEQGIAATDENAWKIREAMAAARQKELDAIEAEKNG